MKISTSVALLTLALTSSCFASSPAPAPAPAPAPSSSTPEEHPSSSALTPPPVAAEVESEASSAEQSAPAPASVALEVTGGGSGGSVMPSEPPADEKAAVAAPAPAELGSSEPVLVPPHEDDKPMPENIPIKLQYFLDILAENGFDITSLTHDAKNRPDSFMGNFEEQLKQKLAKK